MNSAEAKLYSAALFYLRFRQRTEYEMRMYLNKKLTQYDASEKDIEFVMGELIDQNYINDTQFVDFYIANKTQKGYGIVRIQQELKNLGITRNSIPKTATVNIDTLINKIKRRYILNPNDKKTMQKAYAFLLRRGIEYSVAKTIVEAALKN